MKQAKAKKKVGRPPLEPGGMKVVSLTLSRRSRRQLEDLAARLRMPKARAARVAIEDLWNKTLTSAEVES